MTLSIRILVVVLVIAGSLAITPLASAVPAGPRDTAVILFNFKKNDTSKPVSVTDARDWVFTNSLGLNAWLKEDSNNTVSLRGQVNSVGDVFGWYTIDADSSANVGANCFDTLASWGAMAKSAATAAGRSLAGYEHLIFVYPKPTNSQCVGANGFANPDNGDVYFNFGRWSVRDFQRLLAHELTHALPPGNAHASSVECISKGLPVAISISSDCVVSEYGDSYSAVGSVGRALLNNGYHRVRLGYIPWQNVKTVLRTATSSITLKPSAPSLAAGAATQLVRMDRGTSDTSRFRHMYLEYRQRSGVFDQNLMGKTGVFVRLADFHGLADWRETQTHLVDATPSTNELDEAMVAGEAIYDPVADATVRVTSLSSTGATVAVNPGIPTYSQGAVSISDRVLRFTAASGKRNVISLASSGANIVVTALDPSEGRLSAGSGCSTSDGRYVTCPLSSVSGIRLELGDKDDAVSSSVNLRTDVFAGEGADTVDGGPSTDYLYGGSGSDKLNGNSGNDVIESGDGNDSIYGGAGSDWVSYRDEVQPVTVDLAAGKVKTYNYEDSLVYIENVYGSPRNDVINGDAASNSLDGELGADKLNGAGGNDVLWSGPGGTGDPDTFSGGAGTRDLVNYRNRTNPVYASINGADDDGELFERDLIGSDVEDIQGGSGADFLSGSGSGNVITGGPGADSINTGGGNDQISARDGVGDGTLDCGAGTDTLLADLLPFDISVLGCETTTRS